MNEFNQKMRSCSEKVKNPTNPEGKQNQLSGWNPISERVVRRRQTFQSARTHKPARSEIGLHPSELVTSELPTLCSNNLSIAVADPKPAAQRGEEELGFDGLSQFGRVRAEKTFMIGDLAPGKTRQFFAERDVGFLQGGIHRKEQTK